MNPFENIPDLDIYNSVEDGVSNSDYDFDEQD